MIELRHVNFSYGERPILRDVSIRVDQTESVVIMGPSGSGKSTILRLILGLVQPESGEVLVDGESMSSLPEKHKRELRKRIGMVFQDGALFDSLTVGENVGYYLIEHTDMDWEEITERVVEMLGFVGLIPEQVLDKLPEQLSGGMQRRVAIARALLSTNPAVMLYDEPTTGLDPQSTETVLTLMNKLTSEKKISTIAVTHQIADAMTLADRFIVIDEGMVAFDGTTDELRDCPDSRVRGFLEPFRESVDLVLARKFVGWQMME
ncbi:MAG: ATP-binding cassette domain-containing protein [candidate division Zixibacteria bacterium]|nr:ATP-binding cassette domain-containing protein [candidate division Zixibacteria bacterium]